VRRWRREADERGQLGSRNSKPRAACVHINAILRVCPPPSPPSPGPHSALAHPVSRTLAPEMNPRSRSVAAAQSTVLVHAIYTNGATETDTHVPGRCSHYPFSPANTLHVTKDACTPQHLCNHSLCTHKHDTRTRTRARGVRASPWGESLHFRERVGGWVGGRGREREGENRGREKERPLPGSRFGSAYTKAQGATGRQHSAPQPRQRLHRLGTCHHSRQSISPHQHLRCRERACVVVQRLCVRGLQHCTATLLQHCSVRGRAMAIHTSADAYHRREAHAYTQDYMQVAAMHDAAQCATTQREIAWEQEQQQAHV